MEAATNYAAKCFKKSGTRKYDKESVFCEQLSEQFDSREKLSSKEGK